MDWQACTLETCDAGASFVVTDVVAAPDDSRVIVTGRLRGTADFGLGAVSAKGDDAVLLEVDVATGAAKRVALFGGEDDEVVVAAGFDAQGGLALLGNLFGVAEERGPVRPCRRSTPRRPGPTRFCCTSTPTSSRTGPARSAMRKSKVPATWPSPRTARSWSASGCKEH